MNRFLMMATLSLAIVATGLGGVYFASSQADPFLLKPSDGQVIALGKDIYADNCASCHGEKLEGAPDWKRPDEDGYLPAPPHDESGHTWHHSDDVLFGITKLGVAKFAGLKDHKSNMPAYEGILGDEEIIAVLSFIKSTWSDRIKQIHDQRNLVAQERARK